MTSGEPSAAARATWQALFESCHHGTSEYDDTGPCDDCGAGALDAFAAALRAPERAS